jgi:flagellar protein FlbD
MIVLHRLGHDAEPFHLNPDLIVTVEALPDTVVTLTTGAKIVVLESPDRVADEVRAWRAGIAVAAQHVRPRLRAIEGSGPAADHPG